MAGNDSEELDAARSDLDRAVRRFVDVVARERGVTDNPVVIGWVGYAEYTSIELEKEEATASVNLVPDNQQFSLSRGLFECGTDSFRRSR